MFSLTLSNVYHDVILSDLTMVFFCLTAILEMQMKRVWIGWWVIVIKSFHIDICRYRRTGGKRQTHTHTEEEDFEGHLWLCRVTVWNSLKRGHGEWETFSHSDEEFLPLLDCLIMNDFAMNHFKLLLISLLFYLSNVSDSRTYSRIRFV